MKDDDKKFGRAIWNEINQRVVNNIENNKISQSKPGLVTWEYKGEKYFVTRLVRMKNSSTRQWVAAVEYRPLRYGLEGTEYFVREAEEFHQRFRPIGHV